MAGSFATSGSPFQRLFDAFQDSGRLGSVLPGANFQGYVGPFPPQFGEEDVGEILVVVLAGVDKRRLDAWVRLQCAKQWGHLHEVWPSPDDAH
jgi:hypothetical protein